MPDCNSSHSVMPKTKHPEEDLVIKSGLVYSPKKKACFDTRSPSLPSAISTPLKTRRTHAKKSVSFNEHSLVEIIEFEDDVNSKDGRKKFWEFFAADRSRFKDRVECLESLLSPILSSAHRSEIYFERMLHIYDKRDESKPLAVAKSVTASLSSPILMISTSFSLHHKFSSQVEENSTAFILQKSEIKVE